MYAVQKEIGDQEGLRQEWDHHLALAESTKAMLNYERDMAKGKPGMVFAFDLQKTKALPYLSTSEAYYINNCPYTIWEYMTVALERDSSIFGMKQLHLEDLPILHPAFGIWLCQNRDKGVRPEILVAFSDACGGQNRNFIMAVFWMHVTQEMTVDSIDHIFTLTLTLTLTHCTGCPKKKSQYIKQHRHMYRLSKKKTLYRVSKKKIQ